MSIAVTITRVTKRQNEIEAIGTLTASSDYVSGGDTVDFTGATLSGVDALPTQQGPDYFEVKGEAGYRYAGVEGALDACKVKVFEDAGAAGAQAELAAAAYPAAITGDTIKFRAVFPALQ